MQNKHELWKFLVVTHHANMGAKTEDFWQGRIQRQEQRLEKLGANHFFAIAKPVNDTNQSGQSVLPIIRQVNKMIINVEVASR